MDELNEEIAEKEAKVSVMKSEMQVLEELCLEQDNMLKEQKQKVEQIMQENNILKEQLTSGSEGEMKLKITELFDKQKQLIAKLSKANQKEINSYVMEITLGLQAAHTQLY